MYCWMAASAIAFSCARDTPRGSGRPCAVRLWNASNLGRKAMSGWCVMIVIVLLLWCD